MDRLGVLILAIFVAILAILDLALAETTPRLILEEYELRPYREIPGKRDPLPIKRCGNYFAAGMTRFGEIAAFIGVHQEIDSTKVFLSDFLAGEVMVTIDENQKIPAAIVLMLDGKDISYSFRMSTYEYVFSPCLHKRKWDGSPGTESSQPTSQG